MKRTAWIVAFVSFLVFSGAAFAGIKHTQKTYSSGGIDSLSSTQDQSWVDAESEESHDIEV